MQNTTQERPVPGFITDAGNTDSANAVDRRAFFDGRIIRRSACGEAAGL